MRTLARDDAPTTRLPIQRPGAGGRHARPEIWAPAPAAPWPSAYLHPTEAPAGLGTAWAHGGAPTSARTPLGRRLEEAFGPNGLHEIPPPTRRHPRIAFAVVGGFVLAAVILLAALAVPGTMTVQGSFTAHGSSPLTSGATCWSGLYAPGTSVTVVDGRGALVATGRLDDGQATTDSTSTYGRYGYATDCTFSFTVSGVPTGEDAYGIRIGSMHNTVVFTAAEMADGPAIETMN